MHTLILSIKNATSKIADAKSGYFSWWLFCAFIQPLNQHIGNGAGYKIHFLPINRIDRHMCLRTLLHIQKMEGKIQGVSGKASMEPTIEKGSYIVGIRIFSELEVGDIIIFRHDGKLLVKRIAAVAGETVENNGCCMTVPDDYYYVLGACIGRKGVH